MTPVHVEYLNKFVSQVNKRNFQAQAGTGALHKDWVSMRAQIVAYLKITESPETVNLFEAYGQNPNCAMSVLRGLIAKYDVRTGAYSNTLSNEVDDHLKPLLEECDKQISASTIAVPDSRPIWVACFIFFAIVLFPFILIPLITKIEQVRLLFVGVDVSKFEGLLSKNSIHILFYALPAAIAVSHGISVSAWKTSMSESTRLRLYKLSVLRVRAVLKTHEWVNNEDLRKVLLERAFDFNLTNLTLNSEPLPETGATSLDSLVKVVDKLDKAITAQSTAR